MFNEIKKLKKGDQFIINVHFTDKITQFCGYFSELELPNSQACCGAIKVMPGTTTIRRDRHREYYNKNDWSPWCDWYATVRTSISIDNRDYLESEIDEDTKTEHSVLCLMN